VVAALAGASAAPASVVARSRAITFDIELGYWCVAGRASDDVRVAVTWSDDEGVVKQRDTVRSDATGHWVMCGDTDEDVEAGDRVSARVGTASRSVTVPALRLVPDRGPAGHATGHGPPGSRFLWTHCQRSTSAATAYWGWSCPQSGVSMTSDGSGSFGFTTARRQLGGDLLVVTYLASAGDRITRAQRVPWVWVVLGRERFGGHYLPMRRLTVQLRSGDALKAEWVGRADTWYGAGLGAFYGRFADEDGIAQRVRVGDRVVSAQLGANADFRVPAIALTANRRTDVVSGDCGPAFLYGIDAHSSDWERRFQVGGRTSAGGAFTRDLSSGFDLRPGDTVWAYCVLPTGDQVGRRMVVQ
jgi:hypothetical protein